MLKVSNATTNKMGKARVTRGGRSTATDRGGIRKRGSTRIDRDGDLDMSALSERGRGGKRGRGDSGRGQHAASAPARKPAMDRERTINTIQKALSGNVESQANVRTGTSKGSRFEQVSVRGWKQSKAASNPDGGVESLVAWLEKKVAPPDSKSKSNPSNNITKPHVNGDALIVSVRPELLGRMLQISGFSFAGANLTIESVGKSTDQSKSAHTEDTKARMTAFLANRFLKDAKILNLSGLANDPILTEMGLFGSTSTETKFIPALMKVWEMNFDTPQEGRKAVESVSLANNNLANISIVTALSQTFPDLKNLDLSNNNFKDAQALIGWRWKFRKLEFLDLTGSPFSSDPTFKDTMLKWYPKLKTLNNMQVRTDEEILAQHKAPIPVQPAYFQDDSQIAENFVKAFFVNYDNDRNNLLGMVYDQHSTFSLNVNPAAPRGTHQDHTAGWDQYIKKSRNLLKINHLPARMSRAYTGVDKIRELWNTLPKTKHPDMSAHPEEWLIECHPVPGLPDPAGQITGGVGGLVITIHGKFEEVGGPQVETRSFDRTFILGPGSVPGGIRVLNDMLTLRAHGGHEAWNPDKQAGSSTSVPPPATAAANPPKHPQAPEGYGLPAPAKTDAQVQQEQMVLQLSFKTSMTLQFSEMALTGNNWNLDAALKNFEELKSQGKLPQDAFLPAV